MLFASLLPINLSIFPAQFRINLIQALQCTLGQSIKHTCKMKWKIPTEMWKGEHFSVLREPKFKQVDPFLFYTFRVFMNIYLDTQLSRFRVFDFPGCRCSLHLKQKIFCAIKILRNVKEIKVIMSNTCCFDTLSDLVS